MSQEKFPAKGRPPRNVQTTSVVASNIAADALSEVLGGEDGLRITKSAGRPVAMLPVLCSKPRAHAPLEVIMGRASCGVIRPASMRQAASARIERSGLEPRPSVPRQTRTPVFLNSVRGGSLPDKACVVRGQTTRARVWRWHPSRAIACWLSTRYVP